MSDFLDAAWEQLQRNPRIEGDTKRAIENVFNATVEARPLYANAYLDLRNIETLFGLIETAIVLNRFPGKKRSLRELRKDLITLICTTLEERIGFSRYSSIIQPPSPFPAFRDALYPSNKIRRPRMTCSFITFNYDLTLDAFANAMVGGPAEYYLRDNPDRTARTLLKLHGSLNWGKCPCCNNISEVPIERLRFMEPNIAHMNIRLGSRLHELGRCLNPKCKDPKNLVGPPVILPPTWNKTLGDRQLARVWRAAADEFARAEAIYVIGYSAPETDLFFRYIYTLGVDSDARIQRFWVFDPDDSGRVEKRFRSMIGGAVADRFRYESLTFEEAISDVLLEAMSVENDRGR